MRLQLWRLVLRSCAALPGCATDSGQLCSKCAACAVWCRRRPLQVGRRVAFARSCGRRVDASRLDAVWDPLGFVVPALAQVGRSGAGLLGCRAAGTVCLGACWRPSPRRAARSLGTLCHAATGILTVPAVLAVVAAGDQPVELPRVRPHAGRRGLACLQARQALPRSHSCQHLAYNKLAFAPLSHAQFFPPLSQSILSFFTHQQAWRSRADLLCCALPCTQFHSPIPDWSRWPRCGPTCLSFMPLDSASNCACPAPRK